MLGGEVIVQKRLEGYALQVVGHLEGHLDISGDANEVYEVLRKIEEVVREMNRAAES